MTFGEGKKVCMILDNPFTSDKRVYKEAKTLVDNGYDVTVYCQKDFENDLPLEEHVDGIFVKRVFQTNLGTSTLVDKYLQAHFDLMNSIQEKSYHVYHCHDTETWPLGYMLAEKNKAKLVCDSHEYFPDYICREWHADLLKYELTELLVKVRGEYIRYADRVITVSDQIAEALYKEFNLSDMPTVLYNTRPHTEIPENRNQLREKYGINEDTPIILFQGLVEPSRGVDLAIKALPYIRKGILVIAGRDRGGYGEELKILAEQLGVTERVIFTGFMSPDDLFLYSTYADILIYFGKPSVLNMEYSIPNKFFDYIFAGKPMLVSDLTSLKSLVQKYDIGELVDIHQVDIHQIADKLNDLLRDEQRKQQIVSNMKMCMNLFSWEKQEEKLLSLYESL